MWIAAALTAIAMAPAAQAQETFYIREKVNMPSKVASTKDDVPAPVCSITSGQATTGGSMLGRSNTTIPRAQYSDSEIAQKTQGYCATFPGVTNCMVTIYDYNNGQVLYAAMATKGARVIPKEPMTVASNPPARTSTWAGTCS